MAKAKRATKAVPTAAELLRTALDNARWILDPTDGGRSSVDDGQIIEVAGELAENIQALDAAIRRVGTLPAAWLNAARGPRSERQRVADGLANGVPPCVSAMGCLCAGHARGATATAPCDTSEG